MSCPFSNHIHQGSAGKGVPAVSEVGRFQTMALAEHHFGDNSIHKLDKLWKQTGLRGTADVAEWIDHADEVLIEPHAEARIFEQRRKTHATKSYSQWLDTAMEKRSKSCAQLGPHPIYPLRTAHGISQQPYIATEHAGTHGGMGRQVEQDTEARDICSRPDPQTTSIHDLTTRLDCEIRAPYFVEHERKPSQRS